MELAKEMATNGIMKNEGGPFGSVVNHAQCVYQL